MGCRGGGTWPILAGRGTASWSFDISRMAPQPDLSIPGLPEAGDMKIIGQTINLFNLCNSGKEKCTMLDFLSSAPTCLKSVLRSFICFS